MEDDAIEDPVDELLQSLGARHREREAERWRDWYPVAAGLRAPEDAARSRLAAGDKPEEVELVQRLLQPHDDARRDAVIRRALEQAKSGTATPPAAAEVVASIDPQPRSGPKLSRRRAWMVGGSLAAAAAVLAIVVSRDDPQLPGYVLATAHGRDRDRALDREHAGPLAYRMDQQFSWSLEPGMAVSAPVEAALFFCRAGELAVARHLDAQTSELMVVHPNGAVTISGAVAALGLEPGRWTVVSVISVADHGPQAVASVDELVETRTRRLVRFEIEIEPTP